MKATYSLLGDLARVQAVCSHGSFHLILAAFVLGRCLPVQAACIQNGLPRVQAADIQNRQTLLTACARDSLLHAQAADTQGG